MVARQKTALRHKLFYDCKLIAISFFLICIQSKAEAAIPAYEVLNSKANAISNQDQSNGWGYLVSGGGALAFSIPAYFLSEDVFAKAIYTITQTMSVAAIGYGSYLVLIDNEFTRFRHVLNSAPELSSDTRNRLSRAFLEENARRASAGRKIRAISHGLTAGLNWLNAFTTQQRELRASLIFLGSINTLAAISFSFSLSKEEREIQSLSSNPPEPRWEVALTPVFAGIQWHF